MKITVIFYGAIRQQVGKETVYFDLPDGAVYGDLLQGIGLQFGQRISKNIWDSNANAFKAGIRAVGSGRYVESKKTPLIEDEEIKIMPALSGG